MTWIVPVSLPAEARTNAIWRPSGDQLGWESMRRVRRQAVGLRGPDHLDVDVPVVPLLPVPREGDLVAVRRERGVRLVAGGRGQRDEVRRGPLRLPRAPDEQTAGRQRQRPHQRRRHPKAALRDAPARVGAVDPESDSSFSSCSSTFTSAMCWKRRPGSLRRQCRIDPLQLLRHVGHELARRLGLLLQQSRQHLGRRATPERPPARHHLVEHRPEGEDVAARVDRAARRPAPATCTPACRRPSPAG